MIRFNLNGSERSVDVDPSMPLLWVLRDVLTLTGSKYGCGIAQCGACTVHIDDQPVRACVMPISAVAGKNVITIEGLSNNVDHPVQAAWKKHNVPQCGYCQSGQIMSAVALLSHTPKPTDEQIELAMSGNICRCGTYTRIKEAIHLASKTSNKNAVNYFDPKAEGDIA